MSKHTPGKWNVGSESFNKMFVISQTGVVVADCSTANRGGGDDEEKLANARLIAAAKDTAAERDRLKEMNEELLAALKEARDDLHRAKGFVSDRQYLIDAIAKAEGK